MPSASLKQIAVLDEDSDMVIHRCFILVVILTLASSRLFADDVTPAQDFEAGIRFSTTPCDGLFVEASSETPFGTNCLKVSVQKDFSWRWKGWDGKHDLPLDLARLAILTGPYIPPETDAIRMKVRVASGRATLVVGGPVSQMGTSDVFCDPQTIETASEWQSVEFSLNHRLTRNYRRPNFTTELPVIYYTRWIQEPVYLYLLPQSGGQPETSLFIDDVEFVAKGESQPFPVYTPEEIEQTGLIASFDSAKELTNVFSVSHGTGVSAEVPKLSIEANARGTLLAECSWAEEGQIVSVATRGNPDANAIEFALKADFPATIYPFTRDGVPSLALDFVLFIAPGEAETPWREIRASGKLKPPLPPGDFAFYTTRRYVPAGVWSTVVIPWNDFICVYGQGAFRNLQQKQMPVPPASIIAAGCLAPFGARRGAIEFDRIAFARVQNPARSFWQVPEISPGGK